MSYKWPGIPNGDYSFDHGRAVWNKIINFLRRLCEKLDGDLVDATSDRRGLMTAEDKAALDAIPDTYVRKDGDTVTGNINSTYGVDGVETVNQFSGEMAGDDLWAIRTGITGRPDPEGAATGDNGFLEIATADNGTEPIYISQYIGDHILPNSQGERFFQLHRRATLLDEQGNTVFPGTVTALNFNGNATRANYATSAGSATSAGTAAKLGTADVGSATQPIYLEGGVATACTYQLHKTVPADAVFTDTIYTHPTTAGNKHIPSGGSSGQILRWCADGTAVWDADTDTVYTHPTYTARTGKPATDLTPAFGGTVTVSQVESDGTGHVTGMTDRTITVPATEASQSARGLMSAADKKKLDGITAGAEPNQNAFASVLVDNTNVAADTKSDTLTLVAGNNITLTPDATNDKITIAAKDTVTTVSTTGNGNAVTSITASNGALTVKKDSTFSLSDHTHSYLPLSGGTITGSIQGGSLAGTLVGGTKPGGALVSKTNTNGFSAWLSGYTKNYNVGFSTYPGNSDLVYLYSVTKADADANTNKTAHSLTWNAATGQLTADSFNGFTIKKSVPADAKFTDTVTTATTSGSGNAVTAVTANNGQLSVTKGASFFPLSGGALTGTDIFRSEGNSRLFLSGGSAWNTGSQVWVYSKEVGSGISLGAMATDGTITTLALTPKGDLKWGGSKVLTAPTLESGTLTPTSNIGSNYSSVTKYGNVGIFILSAGTPITFSGWTKYHLFTSSFKPKSYTSGYIHNQNGTQGGAYLEMETDGKIYLHTTGGTMPTNDYWHGSLVFFTD